MFRGGGASKAAAVSLEGDQKLSTQYERVAEANLLNYVMIHIRGEVVEDKNGEERGSGSGGRYKGGRRAITDQRENLTRFMMHRKLAASREDLSADKAAGDRGGRRESGPSHPPREGWFGQVENSGGAGGERGGWRGQQHHRRSSIQQEEWGGVHQYKEGPKLYIKVPNPNYTF